LSEGLLCAVINNNMRCYNESTEFADHLDDALAAAYKVITPSLKTLKRCNGSTEFADHLNDALAAAYKVL
jgi:hypothetical protein